MNILLTNNSYLIVEDKAEYLVKDEIILRLMQDDEFRVEFLRTLGVTSVVVSRLGQHRKDYTYRYKEINSKEKSVGKFDKEVGYFAKL